MDSPVDFPIHGRHFVVVGLGLSGVAVCRFLLDKGARLYATDLSAADGIRQAARELQALGAEIELGSHSEAKFCSADVIVLSPGVPHDLAPIEAARTRGVPVMGEIELAARFANAPILAITGTNGKTTVTTLIGNMLRRSGKTVFVGGNIGDPLIGFVSRNETADWLVLEVSSFQLDTIGSFRPHIAVLLNITEDHLDRYSGMSDYARSKFRIFENQRPDDWAILNGQDRYIRELAGTIPSRRLWFNVAIAEGACVCEEGISWILPDIPTAVGGGQSAVGSTIPATTLLRDAASTAWGIPAEGMRRQTRQKSDDRMFQIPEKDILLPGRHNRENVAAAMMASLIAGATAEAVREEIRSFPGLGHRITTVGCVDGVCFVDDSKATNVDAVIRALSCFSKNVVLILGGRDKMSPFHQLRDAVSAHVRLAIVLGESAPAIVEAIGDLVPAIRVSSMEEAVTKGFQNARSGDVVLLSPACSSFDMFTSYAHRGQVFADAVRRLAHDR
ncbi:UDP-N-acetylmuramoyl-L-alanine--D-glutamate ligase [Desulfatirhabdium butyrativorans]|uniref:UDP-N-acetylmuramoyl-L-alanine--D-glutamate ligase n=1 Tax=Desulfatirhabdium butyrativorans TaxID=340467 RepID=UPI0006879B5F|nr:UDP-N-acetylmuramoyl-L-alanine--D-glutamate ligase [Desulfatirhabdium butyrativorans]